MADPPRMADILIVDDDLDMTELLADFLQSEGHEVRVAHDGAEGFKLLRGRMPDLVLLDVEMPVLTGPKMAEAMLVHNAGLENVPVLLSSAVLNLKELALEVGTPYYLTKPYPFDVLTSLIGRALVERTPPRPSPIPSA